MDPKNIPYFDSIEGNLRLAKRHVHFEAKLYNDLYDISYGPEVIIVTDYKEQNESILYPGVYVYIIVLSHVPGENVSKIRDELSCWQWQDIRLQLAEILSWMAEKNCILRIASLDFLRYNRKCNIL